MVEGIAAFACCTSHTRTRAVVAGDAVWCRFCEDTDCDRGLKMMYIPAYMCILGA